MDSCPFFLKISQSIQSNAPKMGNIHIWWLLYSSWIDDNYIADRVPGSLISPRDRRRAKYPIKAEMMLFWFRKNRSDAEKEQLFTNFAIDMIYDGMSDSQLGALAREMWFDRLREEKLQLLDFS